MPDDRSTVSAAGERLIPHPAHEEGSRQHVKWYRGVYRNGEIHGEIQCSEPKCELNREPL